MPSSSSTPKRVTFHSLEPLPDDPEEVKEEHQPSHWIVVPFGSSPREEVERNIELDAQYRVLSREFATLQIRYSNLDKALSNPVLFPSPPSITPWQFLKPRLTAFAIGFIVSGFAALSIWLIVTYH